jgi:hypothetical protein
MFHGSLRSARRRFLALKSLLLAPLPGTSPSSVDPQAVQETIDQLEIQLIDTQDLRRAAVAHLRNFVPQTTSFDGTSRLHVSVMSCSAPWLSTRPAQCQTPAMISREEAQYYSYIGAFYEGIGRAVELGSWLGASTRHIVQSLAGNPNFNGERLYVVDDFVWRAEWMNGYVSDDEKLLNHASFRHLFDKYTGDIRHLLCVQEAKLTDYEGNEERDQFTWGADAIEFLYVDCGRTLAANEAWYNYLRRSFITGERPRYF